MPIPYIVDEGDKIRIEFDGILGCIQYWADMRRKIDRINPNIPFFMKETLGVGEPVQPLAYAAGKTMEWYCQQSEDSEIRRMFPNAETDYKFLCGAADQKRFYWGQSEV